MSYFLGNYFLNKGCHFPRLPGNFLLLHRHYPTQTGLWCWAIYLKVVIICVYFHNEKPPGSVGGLGARTCMYHVNCTAVWLIRLACACAVQLFVNSCLPSKGYEGSEPFSSSLSFLSECRYVAVDLAGHGRSSHRAAGVFYSFPSYVMDVRRVIDGVCEFKKWQDMFSH